MTSHTVAVLVFSDNAPGDNVGFFSVRITVESETAELQPGIVERDRSAERVLEVVVVVHTDPHTLENRSLEKFADEVEESVEVDVFIVGVEYAVVDKFKFRTENLCAVFGLAFVLVVDYQSEDNAEYRGDRYEQTPVITNPSL